MAPTGHEDKAKFLSLAKKALDKTGPHPHFYSLSLLPGQKSRGVGRWESHLSWSCLPLPLPCPGTAHLCKSL